MFSCITASITPETGHFYHMIGLFNIDDKGNFKPDFSKIMQVSKSNTVKSLEKDLQKMTADGFKFNASSKSSAAVDENGVKQDYDLLDLFS